MRTASFYLVLRIYSDGVEAQEGMDASALTGVAENSRGEQFSFQSKEELWRVLIDQNKPAQPTAVARAGVRPPNPAR